MSKPIQKRNCDFCGNYYEGTGLRFCSNQCWYTWIKEQPKTLSAKRFWSKVKITDLLGCWIWQASKTQDGYGNIGVNNKIKRAHRIAWEFAYGSIPKGKSILHKCDEPACCNPSHLFVGSQQDNIADMDAKGRRGSIKGVKNGQHKLTEQNVLTIRSLGKQNIKYDDIGRKFGITKTHVSRIILRKSWKHI